MEVLKLMVEGDDTNKIKIFRKHPHSTWENCFSGDQIMNWIGGNGFGYTLACRRDRLPGDIEGCYLHKNKTLIIIRELHCSSILLLPLRIYIN